MSAARRAALTVAIAALVGVLLTGCGGVEQRVDDNNVTAKYVTLPDGREVVCVFWVSSSNTTTGGGSIECDFGSAR